jgi:hypothetical protein
MPLVAVRCTDLTGNGGFGASGSAKFPEIANVKSVQFLVMEARVSNNLMQFPALANGCFAAASVSTRLAPRATPLSPSLRPRA